MCPYLTIDIGTSSTKACLIDEQGKLLASHTSGYDTYYPLPGWAEQDPHEWWVATQAVCKALFQEVRDLPVNSICLSGQVPSCVPVDRAGIPLRPAILWLDRRAQPQVDQIRARFGPESGDQPGGNRLDSYLGGYKWFWFRQNQPELYRQTWKILQANSYVMYHLTGEIAIDPSHAGLCTPCFDLITRQWDDKVLEWMDLDVGKLPPVRPSTSIIGYITSQASESTGIPVGTPVVCGGGDFALSCLGAGVVKKGSAALMLGTAGNLLVPAPLHTDPRMVHTVYFTGDLLTLGACMAGGAVQWFGDMLGIQQADLYTSLDEEATRVPAGSEGLIFLPYLLGERTPVWDPNARGVFMGLYANHRRGHLFRAVLEGVAFSFRQMQRIYGEKGTMIREIIAINGGARSPLWRQILADVLEVPIRWRPGSSGTSIGAAFLSAMGIHDVTNFAEIDDWLSPTVDVDPNPANQGVYRDCTLIYDQLYDRLKDLFPLLTNQ